MVEAGWLQDGYAYSEGFVYDMYTEYLIYLMGQSSQETDVIVVTPDANAPSTPNMTDSSVSTSSSTSASNMTDSSASTSASASASASSVMPPDDGDELECVICFERIERFVCTESCNLVCVCYPCLKKIRSQATVRRKAVCPLCRKEFDEIHFLWLCNITI